VIIAARDSISQNLASFIVNPDAENFDPEDSGRFPTGIFKSEVKKSSEIWIRFRNVVK